MVQIQTADQDNSFIPSTDELVYFLNICPVIFDWTKPNKLSEEMTTYFNNRNNPFGESVIKFLNSINDKHNERPIDIKFLNHELINVLSLILNYCKHHEFELVPDIERVLKAYGDFYKQESLEESPPHMLLHKAMILRDIWKEVFFVLGAVTGLLGHIQTKSTMMH